MANHTSILPSFFPSLLWMFLFIGATIIMARVWLALAYRGRSGSAVVNVPLDVPVIRRPILTISEATFFRVLQDAVGLQYRIFPQLSLWTMIGTPTQDRKTSAAFRKRIN